MIIFDREKNNTYEEKQYGRRKLLFLYNTVLGRLMLRFFISKTYSKRNAKSNNKKNSARKISRFVKTYRIDLTEFENIDYTSFGDFFIRKIKAGKRPISTGIYDFISPADSKLLTYKIDEALNIHIKNSIYTVSELICNETLAKEYQNGICLVFRLSVDDYHRYIYFDDGEIMRTRKIDGVLHTVTPIATKKHRVFSENYRELALLNTKHFGEVLQIEIGALLVGKINNYPATCFKKGDEKGYFELGGSTIVLLLKENTVRIDEDIIDYSRQEIETKVKLGEKIGVAIC